MIRDSTLDRRDLDSAIKKTFSNRSTPLVFPLAFSEGELADLQRLWEAHVRELGAVAARLEIPERLEIVVEAVNRFVRDLG
jgi:hypothetical protein